MAGKPHFSEAEPTVLHSSRVPIFLVLIPLSAILSILATYFVHPGAYLAKLSEQSLPNVPMLNADEILTRCMSLKVLPGPPPAFHSRDTSDRFEPGTNATWIKNGVIFTGEENGTVVISGDLFLDKGIVRAIGRIPGWMLDQAENLTTVDARGAWITPGLGRVSR
jgi:hypothetical protein